MTTFSPTTQSSPDAATWHPTHTPAEPTFGKGRPPWMTWCPWERSQNTELGATAINAWYRRCRTRGGCRIWAGPYTDITEAKTDGMDHQHHAHDLPAAQAERREHQP